MNASLSEIELAFNLQTQRNIHRIRKAQEKIDDDKSTERVESKREELDFNLINEEFKL